VRRAATPPLYRVQHHSAALSANCPPATLFFADTLPQDILTDDEIISDSYDIKEIDGVAYEADCKKISVGGESFGAHFRPALAGLLQRY
jgi:hypothetical protein